MKPERLALLLVIAATGCMVAALWLPLLHSSLAVELPSWVPEGFRSRLQEWLVETARLPIGDYSLWRLVRHLFAHGEYIVGSVVVLFAVILPLADLALCALLALRRTAVSGPFQERLLRVLGSAPKWSMGNVFIVSLLIVFAIAPGFRLSLEVRSGLYWYVAAVLLSLVVAEVIRRNAGDACQCASGWDHD